MSERQRKTTYAVLAVAVFAVAMAAYSIISAQSSVALNPQRDSAAETKSLEASNTLQSLETRAIAQSSSLNTTNSTSEEKTLTVAGLGSVNLAPDMVSINLGFDTLAPTAQEAVQKNTETMNKIIQSLKALGLEEKEVRTSYFSVYPQYSYDPEGKKPANITSYQASNNVNIVTKKIDNVAEIIDKAISAGANRVDGPYFSLSTDAQKNLRSEVLNKAMKDAEERADILLVSQNLSIKGIKSISISEGGYPIAYLERAVSGYSGAAQAQLAPAPYIPPPPVLPGEQQVTATVVVTYIVA